jgi:Na+-driven multidrug efflux pump
MIVSLFMTAVVIAGSDFLVRLVLSGVTTEILDYAKQYLLVTSVFYFALSTLIFFRNILQGISRNLLAFLAGALELFARWLFSFLAGIWLGYIGVILSISMCWVITAVYLSISGMISLKKLKKELAPKTLIGAEPAEASAA